MIVLQHFYSYCYSLFPIPLFSMTIIRKMDTAGASPPPQDRMDNTELEKETFKAFNEGRAMCVFPEGTSHSESHILHLKGLYNIHIYISIYTNNSSSSISFSNRKNFRLFIDIEYWILKYAMG